MFIGAVFQFEVTDALATKKKQTNNTKLAYKVVATAWALKSLNSSTGQKNHYSLATAFPLQKEGGATGVTNISQLNMYNSHQTCAA